MIGLFIVDRLLKYYALYRLPIEGQSLVGNSIALQLEQNSGVGYGLAIPSLVIYIVTGLALIALVAVLVHSWRVRLSALGVAVSSMIVGAVSNLIDRIRFGYVIDYIAAQNLPVFNLADILIVAGSVTCIILLLRRTRLTAADQS